MKKLLIGKVIEEGIGLCGFCQEEKKSGYIASVEISLVKRSEHARWVIKDYTSGGFFLTKKVIIGEPELAYLADDFEKKNIKIITCYDCIKQLK